MKRLVLIDGHAMVYRAYYAYPTLSSPSGQLVNAVYGFTALLLKTVEELKPDYLAVAFDLPVPTFRHEAYIAYQAKRKAMDTEMKDQISAVQEVIEAAGIPIFAVAGYEADDVIATIAKQTTDHSQQSAAKKKKAAVGSRSMVDEVVIVTGDRDMLQLVNGKIKICMPIKGVTETRIFDSQAVKEYLGVTPEQVVDYKALIGDSSDNYPGVPGIGPKTAVGLIEKYGTLENIYKTLGKQRLANSAQDFPGSLAGKLTEGYESGVLSRELAAIKDDVPVGFSLGQAKLNGFKENKKLISKLEELGFRSLISRITGKAIENKRTEKPKNKKTNVQMGLI